jgi:hypothetical protein
MLISWAMVLITIVLMPTLLIGRAMPGSKETFTLVPLLALIRMKDLKS